MASAVSRSSYFLMVHRNFAPLYRRKAFSSLSSNLYATKSGAFMVLTHRFFSRNSDRIFIFVPCFFRLPASWPLTMNGLFFLKAGCVVAVIGALDALITLDALLYALLYLFGLAFAFYPLVKWCRENEGFSWPWPHVQSERKRIKELRREQESQEKAEQDSDKK